MKKQKNKNEIVPINEQELANVQKNYIAEIDSNPEYSLEVDPTNRYNMTQEQKKFIESYVQFKNIGAACELSGVSLEDGKKYYLSYAGQLEIRRINRALYHRQFASRLLSLDELGGYLGALLTDENVPVADQLKSSDKLKVVSMLMDLIKMKAEAMKDPNEIMNKDIEIQIKNLSVNTLQQLLVTSDKDINKKKDVLSNNSELSVEEKEYLQTLPTEDLLALLEDTNKRRNE